MRSPINKKHPSKQSQVEQAGSFGTPGFDDPSATLAMPKRSGEKKSLTVLPPAVAPDLSRVRLFINEIGVSFFRVISNKFSVEVGYGPQEANRIKDGIKSLRDLGQEFMAAANEPHEQRAKGNQLRSVVEQLFAAEPAVAQISEQAQVAIVKSFQLFLYLVEEAQNAERELRGRARASKDPAALDPLLEAAITTWGQDNRVAQALSQLSISFVFTKHPTTIKYSEMNQALRGVSDYFARPDYHLYYRDKGQRSFNAELDDAAIEDFRLGLDQKIGLLWDLPAIRPQKPTVRSEIEEGYAELRNEIAPAMAAVRAGIVKRGFNLAGNSIWHNKQWMGFDVDGNPYVDKNCAAAALYLNNVRHLADTIDEFDRVVANLNENESTSALPKIRARLQATLTQKASSFDRLVRSSSLGETFWYQSELAKYASSATSANPYSSAAACLHELRSAATSSSINEQFEDIINNLETTGFTLASGMFRENSNVLELMLAAVIPKFKANSSLAPSEALAADELAQNERLIREYFSKEDALALIKSNLSSLWQDAGRKTAAEKALQTIDTLEFLARAQSEVGAHAVPEFILSLTENKSQILAYGKLLDACGIKSNSRVIPLFEEYESLNKIDSILRELFSDPEVVEMLKGEDNKVTIFLGMSDGQKTTGPFFPYLAADAEEKILEVCAEYGLEVVVFHGIGSSQARGQDRHPEREYAARPSLRNAPVVERTIQGEAIQRLQPQDLSKHVGAIILNHLKFQVEVASPDFEKNRQIDQEKRAAVKQMSAIARQRFAELTLSNEFSYFLGHFSAPLDSLNPASRPNNRSAKKDANPYKCDFPDLRAVPANYQDIQAQTLLSTWYGAGQGLQFGAHPSGAAIRRNGVPYSELLFPTTSEYYDARFRKNIQFMIEAIASSGLDVTAAMLEMRLDQVQNPEVAGYLKTVLSKLNEAQELVVTELEKFVPSDGSADNSPSMRARAFAMLDSPLLKDDIARRLPYITVLSFIAARGLNLFDQYSAKSPELAQFGFELARIAACGKANGYRQVG